MAAASDGGAALGGGTRLQVYRERALHTEAWYTGGARKMRKDDLYKNSKGLVKHKKCSEGQVHSEKHNWRNALTWALKELKKHEGFQKVQLFDPAVQGLARAKCAGREEAHLIYLLKAATHPLPGDGGMRAKQSAGGQS